jgi:hypothetical protein
MNRKDVRRITAVAMLTLVAGLVWIKPTASEPGIQVPDRRSQANWDRETVSSTR